MTDFDKNPIEIHFNACWENHSFARTVCAAYIARFDPTVEELTELKTAVSEAVSNAIIHGYNKKQEGEILMELAEERENIVHITIMDKGRGISDIKKAREPLFTTAAADELSGMGFTVMESFTDDIRVESVPGEGTKVILIKRLQGNHE